MIEIAGKKLVTLDDEIKVNGKRISEVWVNHKKVYPEYELIYGKYAFWINYDPVVSYGVITDKHGPILLYNDSIIEASKLEIYKVAYTYMNPSSSGAYTGAYIRFGDDSDIDPAKMTMRWFHAYKNHIYELNELVNPNYNVFTFIRQVSTLVYYTSSSMRILWNIVDSNGVNLVAHSIGRGSSKSKVFFSDQEALDYILSD